MLDKVLAAERFTVAAALTGVCVLAWVYLAYMAWGMEHMQVGADMVIMPNMASWGVVDLLLVFTMWVIMMVAMMLPSAAPMILMFVTLNRRRQVHQEPYVHPAAFVSGYLAVWTAFSALATLAQWRLLEARLVSPMMESASPAFGGLLLIFAGVFQFSRLKHACLTKCRSPLSFIMTEWRDGAWGAFAMGVRHGVYCAICCWLLMLLLFVFGVMNLLWIAVLAAFVLLEKTLPAVRGLSATTGVVLIGWGIFVLTK